MLDANDGPLMFVAPAATAASMIFPTWSTATDAWTELLVGTP